MKEKTRETIFGTGHCWRQFAFADSHFLLALISVLWYVVGITAFSKFQINEMLSKYTPGTHLNRNVNDIISQDVPQPPAEPQEGKATHPQTRQKRHQRANKRPWTLLSRAKEEIMSELLIKLTWDPDTCVWIAESDDVPGLVLESGSFDALIERVRFAVPELLELNGTAPAPVQIRMVSERCERLAI